MYVVFRDNGQWGIEQGKDALAAGGPPGFGETWISFPKDPELFAIPRASVWKTKTQAKKFLAKMMAAEEEGRGGGQEGRRGHGRGGGREQRRGRGRGGQRGWTGGRFGCYRG